MVSAIGVAHAQDAPEGGARDASPTSSPEEAAVADAKLEATDEVVISASKTRQPVSHVTSAVEVITGEQMHQRNLKTVAEALRLATGLAVFSSGAQGATTNVRMRGSTPEQVLVLIDGAIVNSATAGAYDFAFLTTDNIERVEILRGNQSMLWGSDAMGGVISITTKRGRGPLAVGGFLEYGSYNSLREGGEVRGQKGPFDWSATLTRWDISSTSAINFRRGASERDGLRNWQGSGRFGWNLPTKGRLELDVRWLNSFTKFDGFNGTNPADVLGAGTSSNQFIYSGNIFQPLTRWWSTRITAARATDNLTTQDGTFFRDLFTGETGVPFQFGTEIRTYSNRIEWQNNFQIAKPLSVMAGYQFREMIGTSVNSFSDRRVASNAGFAEAQLNLWDRVFGTAGIRQDEFNVFGSATTYRLTGGYLHKETGTKLRASYATGFHAPTINQLFFPGFGNPNLRPEKSQGGDVGIDQTLFDKRVTISANYFWTRYRDQILTIFDPVACAGIGFFGFCPLNFGSTTAKGVEVSIKANLLRDLRWARSLDVQGQYTHTATRDMTAPPHNRLPRWPLQQYSAIISYQPIDAFRMNLEFRYVGQRFNDAQATQSLPGFDVWNLSATYDIAKQVQGYLRVENLFDRRYEEVLYFGTPSRSIFGGIRVNFSLL
jgi:vitamin B12 transporter